MGADRLAFAGAVLCGGASRRMGRDKAVIPVADRALAAWVADAIGAAGAGAVVAVGGDATALEAEGLAVVADAEPGAGPLGGILGALDHHRAAEIVFVGACDLVAPSSTAIAATVRTLADTPAADVAVPVVGGRRQWMHAAWRRRAAPPLAAAFAAGERAVHAAVGVGGLAVVELDVVPASVADADVPEDLPARSTVDPPGGPVDPRDRRTSARD
ncbi:MAG: NTP transferase domain-containing protein [Acidimicrobiales bacterium]|nr:NTP transferase domain-containing protein [Acidimicrobiales bacterium]